MRSNTPHADFLNQLMEDVPDTTLSDFMDLSMDEEYSEYIAVIERLNQMDAAQIQ